jgi:hypothetical protein
MASIYPVQSFNSVKVITMSLIASIDVQHLNLPAIFCLLPVTKKRIEPGMKVVRKAGKIKFPLSFNEPGQILSMSYNGQVRGIIRSEKISSFPHSIILDVGTTSRIVSVKLSQTIEITGPTSYSCGNESANYVLEAVKNVQKELDYLHENLANAYYVGNHYLIKRSKGETFEDEIHQKIATIYDRMTYDYPYEYINPFLSFILALDRPIYSGSLRITNMESAMINMSFELGFPVDRQAFHHIMNSKPFVSIYNNAKTSSEVRVEYWYEKIDKNTGKVVKARHTISVKSSGYTNHSGPNFESMEQVYYLFMQRVLQNLDKIQTTRSLVKKILLNPGSGREISNEEYAKMISDYEKLKQSILDGSIIPAYNQPTIQLVYDTETNLQNGNITHSLYDDEDAEDTYEPSTYNEMKPVDDFSFGYQPVLLRAS